MGFRIFLCLWVTVFMGVCDQILYTQKPYEFQKLILYLVLTSILRLRGDYIIFAIAYENVRAVDMFRKIFRKIFNIS